MHTNVAPGIHRIEHAHVNCYLIEGSTRADGLTLVDTAHPATWPILQRALATIGRKPSDVRAVVLTHAHFDHLGMARRIRDEWGTRLLVHPGDAYIAEHPYRYEHETSRVIYPFRYPRSIPVLTAMALAGALRVKGVAGLDKLEPGTVLDVPGSPSVVFSPGHTAGHCALHLPDRGALLTGDALVTFNPYTGGRGPHVVSGAATADLELAFASLDALRATGARHVLPGHGKPWHDGIESAVGAAVRQGPT